MATRVRNPVMSGTISVIVPVYNVEQYLPRCLESICGQTYRDLEILLVDDGSTDSSRELCAQFAERDPRIRHIRITNSGVSTARNRGLEAANGRWIGFVDADDHLEPGFYETLVRELTASDKQIVCCGVRAEDPEGNRIERFKGRRMPDKEQDFDREEALLRFLNPDTRILYWAVWNKLYSAELLKGIAFEDGKAKAEDFDFTLRCLLQSNGLRYIPDELYHYLVRPGSAITGSRFSRNSFDGMFFMDRSVREIRKAGICGEVMKCALIARELTAAKILRDYEREGRKAAGAEDIEADLARCREVMSSSREVIGAPLVRRDGRSAWSAVTLKSKALCLAAARFEKLLRFI